VYVYVRVCVFVRVYSRVCGVCVRCVCVVRVFVSVCGVCVMVYVRVSTEIYGDVLDTSRFCKNRCWDYGTSGPCPDQISPSC